MVLVRSGGEHSAAPGYDFARMRGWARARWATALASETSAPSGMPGWPPVMGKSTSDAGTVRVLIRSISPRRRGIFAREHRQHEPRSRRCETCPPDTRPPARRASLQLIDQTYDVVGSRRGSGLRATMGSAEAGLRRGINKYSDPQPPPWPRSGTPRDWEQFARHGRAHV